MRENPFNFDQCAEIIWPHCKCASDLMDVIGVSSPLLSVNFMQRKNPGIFLTCFAKRPKIDDIPRDKLFIIIEWLWKISLKNIVSSLSRTSQTSDFKKSYSNPIKKTGVTIKEVHKLSNYITVSYRLLTTANTCRLEQILCCMYR